MTFQSNIPLGSDFISVSQGDILNNFQALGTAFPVNHNNFNVAGAGKHKFVEFPNQAGDPATAAAETTIYAKDISGSSRMFLREEGNGSVVAMSGQTPIRSINGSTFLPGDSTRAVILKWGTQLVSNAGINKTVTYASAFPNACFNVTLSIVDPNATSRNVVVLSGSTANLANFQVNVDGADVTIFYQAIGN